MKTNERDVRMKKITTSRPSGRQDLSLLKCFVTLFAGAIWVFALSVATEETSSAVEGSLEQGAPCSVADLLPLLARVQDPEPVQKLRYLAQVQTRIRGFWSGAPFGKNSPVRPVELLFRLNRDGRIDKIAITKSSGDDYYDMAALRTVQSAIPLPPMPPDMSEDYLNYGLTFSPGEERTLPSEFREILLDNQKRRERDRIAGDIRLSTNPRNNACRNHLEASFLIVQDIPDTQEGLDTLHQLLRDLPAADERMAAFEVWDLQPMAQHLYQRIINKEKQIKKRLAGVNRMQQFEVACEQIIRGAKFPLHLRNESVSSTRYETKTLGRIYCTAVDGGGTVDFRITDDKSSVASLSVKTIKRSFVVIFKKKMNEDLTEAWFPVEVQTPSDRKLIDGESSTSFMDRLPELVSNK